MAYLERTQPKCPRCAYRLRGIPGARCPECGLVLTVEKLVQHRLRSPLLIWAGFGFIVSALLLSATCVLLPIGFLYLGFFIWWGTAPAAVAEMTPRMRKLAIVFAWAPAVFLLLGLAIHMYVLPYF
ncbi:MAG TPA: hypothetical protein ENJ00_11475 [Phycisphaerales bacterium]|nr:hypothetical protein [Phycisphaerales bacterium]